MKRFPVDLGYNHFGDLINWEGHFSSKSAKLLHTSMKTGSLGFLAALTSSLALANPNSHFSPDRLILLQLYMFFILFFFNR